MLNMPRNNDDYESDENNDPNKSPSVSTSSSYPTSSREKGNQLESQTHPEYGMVIGVGMYLSQLPKMTVRGHINVYQLSSLK